jgi:dipeptidyl aminopeptidase/acylaminoacyl peptidase
MLVTGASLPNGTHATAGVTWWSESRPTEGGRTQIVRRDSDGTTHDLLPASSNARNRVHEYGGGAWWVHGGTIYFTNWSDQRLYRLDRGSTGPVAITPEPAVQHGWRYADGTLTPDGRYVICVREAHDAGGVSNELVAVPAAGGPATVLASGRDFVAAPRVSRDGRRLVWLTWDHPNMPWDSTELWIADLTFDSADSADRTDRTDRADRAPGAAHPAEGDTIALTGAHRIAGRPEESLVQPEWGASGELFVVSDRSDWWNVYRVSGADELVPVHPIAAEVGEPAWVFGQSNYLVADDGTIWFTYAGDGNARLVCVAPDASSVDRGTPYVRMDHLAWDSGRIVAIATESAREASVVEIDTASLAADGDVTNDATGFTVLRPPRDLGLDDGSISRPRHISFPSSGGRTAHGWFYPPANASAVGPDGELPPLLVLIHGGPTSAARPEFALPTQFWTSRGFALVDVDYGGSTSYGRRYRRELDCAWGIVDVDDACAAATFLAEQSLVDGARLAIRGGSAGGFTVLACLANRDVFTAGASYYGVVHLSALARDTHKFESRYLDKLVGPWPEAADVYAERSPLTHLGGLDRPLIVLQGLQDEVVPPAQAELIVETLRANGIPHAYLTFPDEQHGLRIAANIVRSITAELSFYAQVYGLTPADPIDTVDITFATRLRHS